MSPFMDLREIAVLEEGRQARGVAEVAEEAVPICGGMMCRAAPGTWANVAVGLGLTGPVSEGDIDRMIDWFESTKREPRIDVCPFVDPALLRILETRGFVLRQFENVLFRELTARFERVPVSGIDIRPIARDDDRATAEYGAVVAQGFAPSGIQHRTEDADLMARCAAHPRSFAFGAFADNRCIGGGAVEVLGPVAGLYGLSVLPEFRRQGIQRLLMHTRMNAAIEQGASIATIGSGPGVPTERNARRLGFQVAYTKVTLVRPGPGLVSVV